MKALTAAGAAIERELLSGADYSMSQDSDEALARVALLAAAPALAEAVASALQKAAGPRWGLHDVEIYKRWVEPLVQRIIEEAANGRR